MFNKNKKGSIVNVTGYIVIFSFISILALTFAFLNYAIINDYILYGMQEITDDLGNQSLLNNNSVQDAQKIGDTFYSFNFHFDDLWLFVYSLFFISSLIFSYQITKTNAFSFLTLLFYGVLAILFLVSIFAQLTNWFNEEILFHLFPTVNIILPKFYYYLEHVGVFSGIQIVLCMIVNRLDFDFIKGINRKKIEDQAVQDNEVI